MRFTACKFTKSSAKSGYPAPLCLLLKTYCSNGTFRNKGKSSDFILEAREWAWRERMWTLHRKTPLFCAILIRLIINDLSIKRQSPHCIFQAKAPLLVAKSGVFSPQKGLFYAMKWGILRHKTPRIAFQMEQNSEPTRAKTPKDSYKAVLFRQIFLLQILYFRPAKKWYICELPHHSRQTRKRGAMPKTHYF